MTEPELKQVWDLNQSDFQRFPVWVGVHNNDVGESWYERSDDQTYRAWTAELPFVGRGAHPIVLVAATFEFADGSTFSGYINPATEQWDEPLPARRMRDGSFAKPLQWSSRRGGSPLSVLALLRPSIFHSERIFDFHLRRKPDQRKQAVQEFYAAFNKSPNEVFPVQFHADPGLFAGVISGAMEGFYSFPLDNQFEIDTGAALL
jgi:hypothetical protein